MPSPTDPETAAFPRAADIPELVEVLGRVLRARGWRIATAESCTGGLIAAACTDLAGSSDWFERGYITYSNAAKNELLGVPAPLIAQQGAVSEPVARAMATGALAHARTELAVAVTGVAGPGGGSAAKPVGLVWLAWAWLGTEGEVQHSARRVQLPGDRQAVRQATVAQALQGLVELASAAHPGDRAEALASPPLQAKASGGRPRG